MWWVWLIVGIAVIVALVVALQRRGATGVPGYKPTAGNDEQLGSPPGLGGDGGGGL